MNKKIFFIRGLVRESRHWGEFLPIMRKSNDYEIETLQIPGTGELNHITSPSSIDTIVDIMRDQFLSKKGKQNIVVAISLGGMIATNWINRYPNDFDKAVLVNTSFAGVSPLLHRLRPKSILSVMKIFVNPAVKNRERIILEMIANSPKGRAKVIEEWIKIQNESPVKRKSAINQMIAAMKFKPNLDIPKIPIKLITSSADRMVNYKCSLKIADLWKAPISVHDTAGHDIPIDAPDWLKAEILEFL